MRDQFTMPGHTRIEGYAYETHDLECAVEIEPDEAVCCTSWYIARCYVEVLSRGKLQWVRLEKSHPLYQTISDWAYQERAEALAELWHAYLEDAPASQRPPYDDDAEHRTHAGRI